MKINCNQFEGLMTFYVDGDLSKSLTQSFEEHLKECPNCNMKFKVISSIIDDVRGAYKKILKDNGMEEYIDIKPVKIESKISREDITISELSAYIDNELNDENSVRVRKNIISKPAIRNKFEQLNKLRKILSDSYVESKKKLKTDYSKEVIKSLNKDIEARQVCIHCFGFIFIVIFAVALSVWVIMRVL